jgi:hypothetical protein
MRLNYSISKFQVPPGDDLIINFGYLYCSRVVGCFRYTMKDRKFYRVVEVLGVENDRCILVTGPKERVSRGPTIRP